MDRKTIIKVAIQVAQDAHWWTVVSVFVNIDNDVIHPIYSGEQFTTKEEAERVNEFGTLAVGI